jgi:transposase-like protein
MSQKRRKYTPEFRQEALKRMRDCTNVSALARELGIRRKWLYEWKERAAKTKPGSVGGDQAEPERAADRKLQDQVKRLDTLVARQVLELDFFKGALQRVEEKRRKRETTSARESTSESAK